MTYLGNRVGCHKTEDVRLDSLVQPDHGLELRRVERVRLLKLNTALDRLARQALDDVAEVSREFVPETVIDVELALTRGREVGVVNHERGVDERLVVALHRRLAGRIASLAEDMVRSVDQNYRALQTAILKAKK